MQRSLIYDVWETKTGQNREAFLDRVRLESTVLLVQDTTTLNYTGLGSGTEGLGGAEGALQQRTGAVRARGDGVHGRAAVAGGEWAGELVAAGVRAGGGAGEGEPALVPGVRSGAGTGRMSAGTRVVVAGEPLRTR